MLLHSPAFSDVLIRHRSSTRRLAYTGVGQRRGYARQQGHGLKDGAYKYATGRERSTRLLLWLTSVV